MVQATSTTQIQVVDMTGEKKVSAVVLYLSLRGFIYRGLLFHLDSSHQILRRLQGTSLHLFLHDCLRSVFQHCGFSQFLSCGKVPSTLTVTNLSVCLLRIINFLLQQV